MGSLFRRRSRSWSPLGRDEGLVVYSVAGAVGVLGVRDGEVSPEDADRLARELQRASIRARRLVSPERRFS